MIQDDFLVLKIHKNHRSNWNDEEYYARQHSLLSSRHTTHTSIGNRIEFSSNSEIISIPGLIRFVKGNGEMTNYSSYDFNCWYGRLYKDTVIRFLSINGQYGWSQFEKKNIYTKSRYPHKLSNKYNLEAKFVNSKQVFVSEKFLLYTVNFTIDDNISSLENRVAFCLGIERDKFRDAVRNQLIDVSTEDERTRNIDYYLPKPLLTLYIGKDFISTASWHSGNRRNVMNIIDQYIDNGIRVQFMDDIELTEKVLYKPNMNCVPRIENLIESLNPRNSVSV